MHSHFVSLHYSSRHSVNVCFSNLFSCIRPVQIKSEFLIMKTYREILELDLANVCPYLVHIYTEAMSLESTATEQLARGDESSSFSLDSQNGRLKCSRFRWSICCESFLSSGNCSNPSKHIVLAILAK